MKIKVCGMRNPENIRHVAELMPDYMGFIFYKGSKRYAENSITPQLLAELPKSIKKTGVFVNASTESIKAIIKKYKLDAVQLHGRETPRQCAEMKELGVEVIKVFSVDDRFVFENTLLYESCADYFLFDTRGQEYGGNGFPFDWELLKGYLSPKPYFLSGGINSENSKQLDKVRPQPYAIDVNSGFEMEPGLKKVDELRLLFEQLKIKN
ncbi:phosphoribosylanthranilate isomerase [Pontibacter cellulosilyticus]|uniref:N-(5'-phosphoribosyl)anthranilate isomerase n=1 Tax=Pontibacter cellulosilyticus TaxID=1720253 RepID=A0A923N3H4_9BACT|nr:phosphoribosylanthranilate isomerase [Pontibacter cellulosilyticus]MBC5991798.1 phosphoribosylanthranilate isomerase [Pontibacter cellulosilyticus]